MRVKLTYTTELDSLTSKMSELVEEAIDPIEKVVEFVSSVSSLLKIDGNDSVIYSLHALDRARKTLAKADEILADATGLMDGYVKSVINPPAQDVQPPNPPEPAAPIEESENKVTKYWDEKTRTLKEKTIEEEEQE